MRGAISVRKGDQIAYRWKTIERSSELRGKAFNCHVRPDSGLLLPRELPEAPFWRIENDLSTGAPEEIRTPDPQIRRLLLF